MAPIPAKDHDGRTPLSEAIQTSHAEVADILRAHGAKGRADGQ